ncbi:tRNA (guanosine(18)-2'-O)-methyltransferase TrmH [Prochlorococcus sp. MIT 1341]|uniref:tRNA (guanosine(18)-2'-O)-methyltransferase TrmH n=1 Tax=Prochlorococcus sp. MIT 1341 TaxID=3096221 RepID=UPI002A74EE66|nr:tRNA (guanosine(18)-2'-O)-methyltransferase TrmH [Prochlorococcus sp. MIT 1341]
MPLLPRRFKRLKAVLDCRIENLTVLLEEVEKPHNLSAILRSCDAVGALEAHLISKESKTPTFNSTAQGSQKWVKLNNHKSIEIAISTLKSRGFRLYGTNLSRESRDYRECNFCGPTAFVLGAEKWGLSDQACSLVDESIHIPMSGMVQSLNVSVATAILLFEAVRQRSLAGIIPQNGEGISEQIYNKRLFEWAYPEVASWCITNKKPYPSLKENGEIVEDLPRTFKMRY